MSWAGFNCSLPHKVAVIDYLDELAESASIVGAVNCVVARDGRLVGENSDGAGFLAALRSVGDPAGTHVVIFGAGGAARAIAVETALAGAPQMTVVNRNAGRGAEPASLPAWTSTSRRWRLDAGADVIPNPACHDLVARGGRARLPDARRPRHARQPGRHQHQVVDRCRCRPGGHADHTRGDLRRLVRRMRSGEQVQPRVDPAVHVVE